VLHRWLLSLLDASQFEEIAAKLKAPELEGFDENNVIPFLKTQLLTHEGRAFKA